jgi:hypothetical protein
MRPIKNYFAIDGSFFIGVYNHNLSKSAGTEL